MQEKNFFYAPVDINGRFQFDSLSNKKTGVKLTDSDKKYGGLIVKKIVLSLVENDSVSPQEPGGEWISTHYGSIIKNPDESFWMDTLSQSEVATRAWWTNEERAKKCEAIGFKVVRVKFD